MKIRLKEVPTTDEYGHPFKDMEYLVLGVLNGLYYYIDEHNRVALHYEEVFVVTDTSQPEFWVESNGNLIPEEWRKENFLSLHGEQFTEWDEIWFITQFAKGLEKFNLPTFPVNFTKAYDTTYKIELIISYLKIASDYDSLPDIRWEYSFGSFKHLNRLPYFSSSNGKPDYYEKIQLTNVNISGFEILTDVLKQIGSPFEYNKAIVDVEWLQVIRNRILFALWSLWGTNEFDVFQLKYVHGLKSEYVLEKGEDMYLLSFDYFT